MDVRAGLQRKLSTEELMLLHCGVGEDPWESLGLQGDPTSQYKGDKSWIFIGRTDAEAEVLTLWPPHVKDWPIGKDSDTGKDWRWEEKGTTEDQMVGLHHWLNGHELERARESVMYREAWCAAVTGFNELDMTEHLNWCKLFQKIQRERIL